MDVYNKLNLTTYVVPPLEYCSLVELEKLCHERLQLYKIMDEAYNLDYKPNSNLWEEYIESQIARYKLTTYIVLIKHEDDGVGLRTARRNNHIAYWLLSLCYCRTSYLRSFFMKCELYWFVMLYKRMKTEDLREFLADNEIKYACVDKQEKEKIKEILFVCRPIKETSLDSTVYYKTKFTNVSNLVAIRKVFLHKGFAYFPESDLLFCLKNKLWKQFYRQLIWNNKMLPTGVKEDRLEHFLKNIPIVVTSYKRNSDKNIIINLENIDGVAGIHFPLCMKTIHSVLRHEHHLKYDCKMQYGIFLKWVGLSYQDAMDFWKSEFTQKMSHNLFDRKYAYLFKHQYGKVGGMIQYRPYTCDRILNMCPGPSQHHGCPFKHWDLERLLETCESEGFNTADLSDLKQSVIDKKYKDACTVYFNITHKVCMMDIIKSPNQYTEASYEYEDSLNNCLKNIFYDC